MPFADVGTSKRLQMSRRRILAIWEASQGICCLCNKPIEGTKATWYVEHIRALELGGSDTDDNCGPAHYDCKPGKDADDHSRAAEAKREKAVSLGIPKRSTLQGRGFAKNPDKRKPATDKLNKWFGPAFNR